MQEPENYASSDFDVSAQNFGFAFSRNSYELEMLFYFMQIFFLLKIIVHQLCARYCYQLWGYRQGFLALLTLFFTIPSGAHTLFQRSFFFFLQYMLNYFPRVGGKVIHSLYFYLSNISLFCLVSERWFCWIHSCRLTFTFSQDFEVMIPLSLLPFWLFPFWYFLPNELSSLCRCFFSSYISLSFAPFPLVFCTFTKGDKEWIFFF